MPLGLHLPELLVILGIIILLFGAKKLPQMGSAIGESIREFKKGVREAENPEPKELKQPAE